MTDRTSNLSGRQRGFILQPSYRIEGGRPVIHLSGRLESGASFLVRDHRQIPSFWVRQSDAEQAAALGARLHPDNPVRNTMRGEPVLRAEVAIPPDVPSLRNRLVQAGVPCYEADVRFAYRYLIDRGVRGTVAIEGVSSPGLGYDAVYDNPEIGPADWTPALSVLSFDIETDPQATRLLSIALHDCGNSEVLLLTPEGMSCPDDAVPFADEAELLRGFMARVRTIDPDVLTGWNVVDFDLSVLSRVAERVGVPLLLGRGPEPLRLKAAPGGRGATQALMGGRVVLDGIQLLRGAFLRFESYSLQAVASEVLGEGKTMHGSDRGAAILEAFHHDRPGFVAYNRKDAELVTRILEKLRVVEVAVERSRLTGMPPDRVAASIASFDFLYLTELGRRRIVAPTVNAAAGDEATSGGHVIDPVPGLYRNVLVLDFKSLYPSVIRTFQIDPAGYIPRPAEGDDPILAPNGAAFRREGAILPRILDELFPRREAAKKAGDQVASQAIKILMNSFYGVLGTSACRFAAPALANAITGFGREILLWSQARIEGMGYRVLYGDTDSLFVESGTDDDLAARERGRAIVREVNSALGEHVQRTWHVASRLELEFEKLYLRLLLPAARHSTSGARKRYAGLLRVGPPPEVEFTGLEAVRRDWTDLARSVQREIYERLFTDRPVDSYLKDLVQSLRRGRLDPQLVYRKALRKDLDAYTATTPPHVSAARKMKGKPGSIISYVMTTDGAEAVAEQHSPIDHEHYVQKQVRAVSEPVLDLLGLEFDRVVGDDAQLKLF